MEWFAEAFQVATALACAAACEALGRFLGKNHLRHWAAAWGALAAALLSIHLATAAGHHAWWAVYLLAEWLFLWLLGMGCLELFRHRPQSDRSLLVFFPIALLAAWAFAQAPLTFNGLFAVQSLLLATGYGMWAWLLARTPVGEQSSGLRLMKGALIALAILFALYVPVYLSAEFGVHLPRALTMTSLADGILQAVLGAGMIIASIEDARDAEPVAAK